MKKRLKATTPSALVIKNEIDITMGFDVSDDISCLSEADTLNTSKTALNLTRYFGVSARNEFGRRIKWLSNQRKMLYNQRDELEEKTRFESSYDHQDSRSTDKQSLIDDDNVSLDSFDVPTVKDDLQDGTVTSPRTKYIAACLKKNMNPRMSLILRKRVSADLNLQHQGMGDTLGVLFADSLKELPYVHSINLADNNLTDVSIGPILRSIILMSNVTSLNISNNMIDSKSTHALAEYLRSPNCSIQKLILQKSDIDDSECHMFVEALKENSSLLELDLSNNKIGQAETLNTVQPDYITGGEALADMLASNSCKLQYLNLAWNLIRLDGGIALAGCVATNRYVTYLDLSYNALGKDGGEVLGSSLLGNTILRTLLLANNNINFSACFAICVALEENFSLRKLSLDGNPIGEGGGRALMQVPFTAGSRVKVTASGCNLLIKDIGPLFNYSQPNDFYVLHLSNPYHRAVCMKLLRLVANHQTYVFLRFAYLSENKISNSAQQKGSAGGAGGKGKKAAADGLLSQFKDRDDYYIPPTAHEVKLLREYSAEKEERLDEFQLETLANLRVIQAAATDINLARDMFRKFDVDGSGALDRLELRELLQKVGLHLENEVFEQAMDMCDIDGSGELDEDEFLDFIRSQKDEAAARIKDLTEFPVMVHQDNPSKKYLPPHDGLIYALVGDSFNHKGSKKIVTAVDHSNMMDVIRRGVDGNTVTVLEFGIQATYLRQKEAVQIFNAMHSEIKDPAVVVAKILPRMADPIEARSLMMQVINFDKVALRRLMAILGNAFNPLLGIYDGYYSLDMSNEMDRICMSKLLVQSQVYKDQCMDKCIFHQHVSGEGGGPGGSVSASSSVSTSASLKTHSPKTKDVSQKGDWSGFRNEVIDGEMSHISVELFNPIPTKGKVSFDFSGSLKAPREAAVIKDSRCVNVLINLSLVSREDRDCLLLELKDMQETTKRVIEFDGKYESFLTKAKAEECQGYMTRFYSRLLKRTNQYRKALRSEVIRHSNDLSSAQIPTADGTKGGTGGGEGQGDDSDSDDSVDSMSHVVFEDNELMEEATAERQNGIDLSLLELGTLPLSKRELYLQTDQARNSTAVRRGAFMRAETGILGMQEALAAEATAAAVGGEKKESKELGESEEDSDEDGEFRLDDDEDEEEEEVNAGATAGSGDASRAGGSGGSGGAGEAKGSKKKVKKFFNLTRSSAYIADYSSLMRRKQDPLLNANIKASRIVLAIVDILSRVYLKARHLALILKWFPLGRTHRTRHFGTYRVELAVLLYSRVVDLHNMDLVGRVLTVYEWACFLCRIGILNVYNPLKPEGPICLDMSRRDERKVAEILTALSVTEPGENWLEATFRWSYEAVIIPGWELTQSWLTAETVPEKGVVYVNYFSGEGQRLNGCVADVSARKALLALVRIEEADIIHDDDNILEDGSRIHSKPVGLQYILGHRGLWDALLATSNSTSARLAAGESFSSVFPNCSYIRSRLGRSETVGAGGGGAGEREGGTGSNSPEKRRATSAVGGQRKTPPSTPLRKTPKK